MSLDFGPPYIEERMMFVERYHSRFDWETYTAEPSELETRAC